MQAYFNFFSLIVILFVAPCAAKTLKSYNSSGKVESIGSYIKTGDDTNQLMTLERFEWHPHFPGSLTMRSLEDHLGNPLISQSCFYNLEGQLIEEHLQDYITSSCTRHSFVYQEDGNRIRTISYENNISTAPEIHCRAPLENFPIYTSSYHTSFEHSIYEEQDFFYRMSGYNAGPREIGSYQGKEINDKVRITFINGVLNTKEDTLKTVKWISEIHGDVPVHYIFNPSDGWAWDVLKSTLVRWGVLSEEAFSIAQVWKKLIAEMSATESSGTIIHYAHSIGATHTYAARFLMTPEELRMIRVYTFGSPTIIPSEDFQVVFNYISVRDGVGLMDFIGLMKAFIYDSSHIIYVGTYWGIPFIDHLIQFGSYHLPLENLGKAFLEEYKL